MTTPLVKAHRILACGLGVFLILHFAIHLSAIGGVDIHLRGLMKFQGLYRNWLVEPLLIIAILGQIFIGARLLWRRWKSPTKGFWGWAQILSGAYLVFFFIIHTSAALSTRHIVGLDTNFYWAAGTLQVGGLKYFFAPYYFLGVLSVFTHLAAAIFFGWTGKGAVLSKVILFIGGIIASLIVCTFGGVFYDINIPVDYREYFEGFGIK